MSELVPTSQAAQLLVRYEDKVAQLLGHHYEPAEFLAAAEMAVKLQFEKDIEPRSLVSAVLQMAALRLSPLPQLQEAWMVPYKGKVTMIPGWRGLKKIAMRSGAFRDIQPHVVYEGDEFSYALGTDPHIHHVPSTDDQERAITHAYCVAFAKDGPPHTFMVMPRFKIDRIRDGSPGKNSAPWTQHYDEMAKKTAVRALCKNLPNPDVQTAVRVHDLNEAGKSSEAARMLQLEEEQRNWLSELRALCEGDEFVSAACQNSGLSSRQLAEKLAAVDGDPKDFVALLSDAPVEG